MYCTLLTTIKNREQMQQIICTANQSAPTFLFYNANFIIPIHSFNQQWHLHGSWILKIKNGISTNLQCAVYMVLFYSVLGHHQVVHPSYRNPAWVKTDCTLHEWNLLCQFSLQSRQIHLRDGEMVVLQGLFWIQHYDYK